MIFEEWFDNMLDTYPDDYYGVAKDAWNAAIAARDEELRKQEPVAWIHPLYKESGFKLVGITRWSDDCLPLYAAPIAPEPTPSQQEALDHLSNLLKYDSSESWVAVESFILARPDAPIPPDNHDWKAEYLRQVDLHNQTLDELREAEMQLRNPAPTPPTPFQQESVPKGFIVVSKDLLAEAIACNTDASLAEARHIINSVLKVSDDEIFREVLKEESK